MNLAILLAAIATVESGNVDSAIGKRGEVSRYQIMPRVWRSYSASRHYRSYAISTAVAERHLSHLYARLPERARNVRGIAAAWNYGLTNFRLAHYNWTACPPNVTSYVNRVYTTYHALERRASIEPTAATAATAATAVACTVQ